MRPRLSEGPSDVMLRYVMNERLAEEMRDVQLLTDINIAHVVMLAGSEIIGKPVARSLVRVLLELAERGVNAFEDLDPTEGLYLAYEQRLIAELGLDIGGALHTARSRNDLGATLHRLKTRVQIIEIMDALLALRGTLLDSSAGALDMVMTGYTHHQPAQPVTFGHWLLAIEGALSRDSLRFEQALIRTNEMPLGSCALAGTDFSVDQLVTAHLLGFARVFDNSIDAIATRDYALETAAAVSLLGVTLSRFALDLQLWHSPEYGYVDLADGLSGVSSIMPQKKNPVVLEWLKGRAAHLIGNQMTMLSAQKNTSYTNVIDVNRESLRFSSQACGDAVAMLSVATAIVSSIVPQAETMAARANGNFSSTTLLANLLVRDSGLSFREAHDLVARLVRAAQARGVDCTGIDAGLLNETAGYDVGINDQRLREILDPRVNVERLEYGGGPAPSRNASVVANRRERLRKETKALEFGKQRFINARADLFEAARKLAGV